MGSCMSLMQSRHTLEAPSFLRLRDNIDETKLINICLSANPNAVEYLKRHPDKINWVVLSQNPNAIHLIESNLKNVCWAHLSINPNAIHILKAHKNKIDWDNLSMNPNAMHLIEERKDKINWDNLSKNPNAIHLLENNIDRINWDNLSKNPNAIHLLENNVDRINWVNISKNPNAGALMIQHSMRVPLKSFMESPHAVHILRMFLKRCGKTRWCRYIAANPNAIDLIEQFAELDQSTLEYLVRNPYATHLIDSSNIHVDWVDLSENPGIFTYDYHKIKNTNMDKNACIDEWFSHPRFIQEYLDDHDMDELDGFHDWVLDRHVV